MYRINFSGDDRFSSDVRIQNVSKLDSAINGQQ